MDQSLFAPLEAEGLTSLKVQYDWRTGEDHLWAAKEWTTDLDFEKYNSTFDAASIVTSDAVYLDYGEVRELYRRAGLTEYLDEVIDLLRQGRHVGIEAYFDSVRDIRFMCHQHSRRQGVFAKRHAVMAGGIRRHPREVSEIDVIVDGLNLGRAMSFKNVAADLDFGGCKTTVQMDELDLGDLRALGFLAFAIDRCRMMTGPDMRFPTAMADVINRHFSPQITSGPSSPLGESGGPTAYGTYLALREAVIFKEERDSLEGMSAVVMGLGAVGWHLAELLVDAKMRVVVADIDASRADAFVFRHPEADVSIVPVADVLFVDAEVLCPAAIGGIIEESIIPRLKFSYVFGPANNQLRATNQAEEERLARQLADRDILFQAEWWHNTGGVMSAAEEYINGSAASPATLRERIEKTIPANTRRNLEEAKVLGITPTENAYRVSTEAIYGS
nr:Glu/Leu/Phe/Val dehydrogenase dimerization domain-containing protein [uncultured Microbacterium sp.]